MPNQDPRTFKTEKSEIVQDPAEAVLVDLKDKSTYGEITTRLTIMAEYCGDHSKCIGGGEILTCKLTVTNRCAVSGDEDRRQTDIEFARTFVILHGLLGRSEKDEIKSRNKECVNDIIDWLHAVANMILGTQPNNFCAIGVDKRDHSNNYPLDGMCTTINTIVRNPDIAKSLLKALAKGSADRLKLRV